MRLQDLTALGWLLLIVTIVGAVGIGLPVAQAILDTSSAKSLPRIVMMAPIIGVGAAIFFGGAYLLRASGKSISKVDD